MPAVLVVIVPGPFQYKESFDLVPPKNCIESAPGEVVCLVPKAVQLVAAPMIHLGLNVLPVPVNEFPVPVGDEKASKEKSVGVLLFNAIKHIKSLEPAAASDDVIVKPPVVIAETVIWYGPTPVPVEYVIASAFDEKAICCNGSDAPSECK